MMLVRSFSKHFVQMWVNWRGDFPCVEEVNRLISTGQQLRPQLKLFKRLPDGTYRSYTLLAEFWNHDAGAIIRVDELCGLAVTIIPAGRRKEFRRVCNGKSTPKNR
ncbi:MAG: hypothetical protein AAGU11_18315 [Syntrophobacteraceae bacterium]